MILALGNEYTQVLPRLQDSALMFVSSFGPLSFVVVYNLKVHAQLFCSVACIFQIVLLHICNPGVGPICALNVLVLMGNR